MRTFITGNLLKFLLTAVILTFLFRIGLSFGLSNHIVWLTISSSILFAIFLFLGGRYFGAKEYELLPIYDIGFRFHLVVFLSFNTISLLWISHGFASIYEKVEHVWITAIFWGIFLLFHFIYYLSVKKTTIKNLNKNDLFE